MNLGYTFRDNSLLKKALTHISIANDKGIESNQRLEFFGDSILSFIVAEEIYSKFPDLDEGKLTEIRAAAVCEKSLAEASRRMDIGSSIIFGKSEKICNGKEKDSILADTFEAVLGAIYLDSDMETARKWVLDNLSKTIEAATKLDFKNYKSEIQNYFQKRDKGTEVVGYELIEKSGPDHLPIFTVRAIYKGKEIGRGVGNSRKAAEQQAAKQAFMEL